MGIQRISNQLSIETSVRDQAKIRFKLALPLIAICLVILWFSKIPYGIVGHTIVITVAISHVSYACAALYFAKRLSPFSAKQLAIATAVLDPLLLSGWLSMMGEVGGLLFCQYLFATLGFGFRIGPYYMRICQISSIIGFGIVIVVAPIWRQNPLLGLSFLMVLMVVPLYARKLLSKLHEARADAERESKAKSELLAKVSHELRTPLSGVVAAAQLISAESDEPSTTKRAETIMGLSKDLLREINDLLDSAKYEAKALVLESAIFNLHDVIERVRLTLSSTAAAKNISFKVDVDQNIQDRVQGDSYYLSRVLINIAGNAVKFTEQGSVQVSVKLLEENNENYKIRFSVQDTGIGIPQEMHSKIFEPFFQASSGTTRLYGGTGLGMTISKTIVNMMEGEINIESEPNKGSLFYFDISLPRINKSRLEVVSSTNISIIRGKRVLVADDNATNVTLIKELLQLDGHEVVTTKSGMETLDVLIAQEFDVLFLDYNMGDMDGAQVLQIYQFGKLKPAPTFFLTADATEATADKLKQLGAVGILLKPITREGLRDALVQVFPKEETNAIDQKIILQSPLKKVPTQYIDFGVIEDLKAISDRPEFLGQVLKDAASDIERNADQLLEALSSEDINQVRDTAHALKGVCASVGVARLATMADKLMKIDKWELGQSVERWKIDITEGRKQSLSALHNIISNRTANP